MVFATVVAFGHGGNRYGFSVVIGLSYSVGAELDYWWWWCTVLRLANGSR